MQNDQPSLIARSDTFLGICQGLGEDFRFHPNFLRLAFAGMLFWNPAAAVVAYLAAGIVVAVSRLIAPSPRVAAAVIERQPVAAEAEAEREPLPLAA